MKIKRLNKRDLLNVFELVSELAKETNFYTPNIKSFLESWNRFIEDENGAMFGAMVSNNIIGFISGIFFNDTNTGIKTANEMHFYVIPEYRRIGIGKSLYKEFVKWAKENECKLIYFAHPYKEKWMRHIFEDSRPVETYYLKEI